MRAKSSTPETPSERLIRGIRRATMRLLTIQSNTARLALMGNGIYRPSWSWLGNDPDWTSLYRMMIVAWAGGDFPLEGVHRCGLGPVNGAMAVP
jgi:hypothetical protein